MEEGEGEEKGQEEEKPVKHAWKTPGNRKEETTEQKAAPAAETQQEDAAGPTPASGLSVGLSTSARDTFATNELAVVGVRNGVSRKSTLHGL